MDAQYRTRPVTDGAGIILNLSSIRRTDFSEGDSGRFKNFWQTKTSTNFYQLASRNNNLLSCRNTLQRQHCGGRTIVDDERSTRPRQFFE